MVKLMLDIINNALRKEEYYICLYSNSIYIYNYIEILNFNNDLIMIKIKNHNLKIKGTKMNIKKMENKELLIEGIITGVTYE